VCLHDQRHTHASQLDKRGVPVKVIRERLGHANASITLDLHAHVLPGMQEDAARRWMRAPPLHRTGVPRLPPVWPDGRMRDVATIEHPVVIQRILTHLGLPDRGAGAPATPARPVRPALGAKGKPALSALPAFQDDLDSGRRSHAYSISRFVTFDACTARRGAWARSSCPDVSRRRPPDRWVLPASGRAPGRKSGATASSTATTSNNSAPRRLNRSVAYRMTCGGRRPE
jgi:hypothetical protein